MHFRYKTFPNMVYVSVSVIASDELMHFLIHIISLPTVALPVVLTKASATIV